jgi:hypothetical protein
MASPLRLSHQKLGGIPFLVIAQRFPVDQGFRCLSDTYTGDQCYIYRVPLFEYRFNKGR